MVESSKAFSEGSIGIYIKDKFLSLCFLSEILENALLKQNYLGRLTEDRTKSQVSCSENIYYHSLHHLSRQRCHRVLFALTFEGAKMLVRPGPSGNGQLLHLGFLMSIEQSTKMEALSHSGPGRLPARIPKLPGLLIKLELSAHRKIYLLKFTEGKSGCFCRFDLGSEKKGHLF